MNGQMFPTYKNFLPEAYRMATEQSYAYLFLDMTPGTQDERFRVRAEIFNTERTIVYLPK
jgi:hypothetical protein